jgi:hypothetical protein
MFMNKVSPLGFLNRNVANVVLATLALFLLISFFVQPKPLNTFEFGLYLNAGKRILAGQMMYRDFHHHYGPLNAWKAAVLLKFGFQPHQISQIFFIHPMVEFVIGVLLYVYHRRLALFPGIILLIASFSYATGPSSFIVLYCAYVAIKNGNSKLSFISGLLSTFGLWWFHDVFVYIQCTLLISALALVLSSRWKLTANQYRTLLSHCFGVIAGMVAFVIFITCTSDFSWYIYRCWEFTLRYYDKFTFGEFPNLFTVTRSTVQSSILDTVPIVWIRWLSTKFLFLLPPVTVALQIILSWISRRKFTLTFEWILLFYCVVLYRQIIKTGADPYKLQFTLFPSILLALTMYNGVRRPIKSYVKYGLWGLVALITLYTVSRQVLLGASSKYRINATDATYGSATQLGLIRFVNETEDIRDHFVVIPNNPMLYVQCDSKNPISYDYIDPMVATAFDGDIAKCLKDTNVRYIILNENFIYWNRWEYGKTFGVQSHGVIMRDFRPVHNIGSYVIMKRNDNR